VRVEILQAVTL